MLENQQFVNFITLALFFLCFLMFQTIILLSFLLFRRFSELILRKKNGHVPEETGNIDDIEEMKLSNRTRSLDELFPEPVTDMETDTAMGYGTADDDSEPRGLVTASGKAPNFKKETDPLFDNTK